MPEFVEINKDPEALLRLADLALYRVQLLRDDVVAGMRGGRTQKIDAADMVSMLDRWERHFLAPIQDAIREALGVDGELPPSFYAAPEEAVAKLRGNVAAKERLKREGRL